MNNRENFVDNGIAKQSSKSTTEGVAIVGPVRTYNTLERGRFNFDDNTIEFVYRVETQNRPGCEDDDNDDDDRRKVLDQIESMANNSGYDLHGVVGQYRTSFWRTLLRLLLLTCGTPVFMIPRVFADVGYATGSVLLLATAFVYVHCARIVAWSAHEICRLRREPTVAYVDLLAKALATASTARRPTLVALVRLVSACTLLVAWFGVSLFVLTLAAENVRTFYVGWFGGGGGGGGGGDGGDGDDVTLRDVQLMMAVPVLAFSLFVDAAYLESVAAFGFACNAVSAALVTAYAVSDDATAWTFRNDFGTFEKPFFVGVMLINLSTTPALLTFMYESKNTRNFSSTCGVLTVAYGLTVVIYGTLCLVCGLKYGLHVPENSVTIVPADTPLGQINLICYGVSAACVYPYLFCGLLGAVCDQVFVNAGKRTACAVASTYAFRVTFVLLAWLLTYARPSLSLYLSVGGTVCSSLESVVYPPLVHTVVVWKVAESKWRFVATLTKNAIVCAAGVYLVVVGVGISVDLAR